MSFLTAIVRRWLTTRHQCASGLDIGPGMLAAADALRTPFVLGDNELILAEAEDALSEYVTVDGEMVCDAAAHVVTAQA